MAPALQSHATTYGGKVGTNGGTVGTKRWLDVTLDDAQVLRELNVDLEYIVDTHLHADHISGDTSRVFILVAALLRVVHALLRVHKCPRNLPDSVKFWSLRRIAFVVAPTGNTPAPK